MSLLEVCWESLPGIMGVTLFLVLGLAGTLHRHPRPGFAPFMWEMVYLRLCLVFCALALMCPGGP